MSEQPKVKCLPVFPDVGSMIVSPGFSNPLFSASSTILRPIRSFTLPPALKNSHFATKKKNNYSFTITQVILFKIQCY